MSVKISLENGEMEASSNIFRRCEPVKLSPQEEKAVNIVINSIGDKLTKEVHLERRTDNYLTIVVGEYGDFCRIKVGVKSTWFSISLPIDERKSLFNDPRLSVVEDKNLRHWKIPLLTIEQLLEYEDLIQMAYINGCKQFFQDELESSDTMNGIIKPGFSINKSNGEPFRLNENEIEFTNALITSLKHVTDIPLSISWRTGNTLNYQIQNTQIGRIKLRGKNKVIQILTKSKCNWIEISGIDDAISQIPAWIKYTKNII